MLEEGLRLALLALETGARDYDRLKSGVVSWDNHNTGAFGSTSERALCKQEVRGLDLEVGFLVVLDVVKGG